MLSMFLFIFSLKILTRIRAVVKGGTFGTIVGLIGGTAGVLAASRRYQTIRSLTLPMKSFLATSSATFVGIVSADHASRTFEIERSKEQLWLGDVEERRRREELARMSTKDRIFDFLHREKYKIVGVTWIASMVGSFWLVSRNPYLSGSQKIVQARVYAQGLTVAVLVASAGFEIADQKRGKGILDAANKAKEAARQKGEAVTDYSSTSLTTTPAVRDENADLWKDMVAAEEQRLKSKHKSLYEEHHGQSNSEDERKAHQHQDVTGPEQPEEKGHIKLEKDLVAQKAQEEKEGTKNNK